MPKLPKRHKILALDPSSNTGWATAMAYGVWSLTPKRDESMGMRLIRFKSKLKEVCEAEDITLVVFERPGGRHVSSVIVQAEIQGVLKTYCEEVGIEYRAYSSTEIKAFATGKGNAGKPQMIEHARIKLGYKGDDDNEADALWLYQLAKKDLNI